MSILLVDSQVKLKHITLVCRVYNLCLEDVIAANGDIRFIWEKTSGVKLQLVVLCPLFLDQIVKHTSKLTSLAKLLHPNRILALLLGVTDDDVLDIHKSGKYPVFFITGGRKFLYNRLVVM